MPYGYASRYGGARTGNPALAGVGSAAMFISDYLMNKVQTDRAAAAEKQERMASLFGQLFQMAMGAETPGELNAVQSFGEHQSREMGLSGLGDLQGSGLPSAPPAEGGAPGTTGEAPVPAAGAAGVSTGGALDHVFSTRMEAILAQMERDSQQRLMQLYGDASSGELQFMADQTGDRRYAEAADRKRQEEAAAGKQALRTRRREGRIDARNTGRAAVVRERVLRRNQLGDYDPTKVAARNAQTDLDLANAERIRQETAAGPEGGDTLATRLLGAPSVLAQVIRPENIPDIERIAREGGEVPREFFQKGKGLTVNDIRTYAQALAQEGGYTAGDPAGVDIALAMVDIAENMAPELLPQVAGTGAVTLLRSVGIEPPYTDDALAQLDQKAAQDPEVARIRDQVKRLWRMKLGR